MFVRSRAGKRIIVSITKVTNWNKCAVDKFYVWQGKMCMHCMSKNTEDLLQIQVRVADYTK